MSDEVPRPWTAGLAASETAARLFYWLALFSPTLLALWRSGDIGRSWECLLWAAAACAIPAALPRRLFLAALAAAAAMLPALLWWIGYAALNGIGPGWEAATAAVMASPREMLEAWRLAVVAPGFLAASAASVLFLAGSAAAMWRVREPRCRAASSRLQAALATALLPFAISSVAAAAKTPLPVLFRSTDANFSPLGTAASLLMGGMDRALYGDVFGAKDGRRPARAPFAAKEPLLAMFVIGESVRAGAIAPDRAERGPWTRALAARVRAGLGMWLPTTCAGSHGTHLSVPMLLTGTPPARHADADAAPSVLAILKAAGFATAWISNQDASVFKETGHDLYWSVSRTALLTAGYDEDMLPVVQAFVAPVAATEVGASVPRAAVLHMMGSHFDYSDRYPAAIFAAEPAGLSANELSELRYERSVEYSAKVLDALAQLLDRSKVPAFLVFVGDHGENLPHDNNGLTTHLGTRASLRDGTTTALVLWNEALAATGRPKALAPLLRADMIAHADVTRAFLVLAGMDKGPALADPAPQIFAPLTPNDAARANACSALRP